MRDDRLTQARIVAESLSETSLDPLSGTRADVDTASYERIKHQLAGARSLFTGCRFIYLMGSRENEVFFFADSEPVGSVDESPPGQVYVEISPDLRRAVAEGREFVAGPIVDRWGSWMTTVVPLTDDGHKRGIVLGLDVAADRWRAQLFKAAAPAIVMTALLLALIWIGHLLIRRRVRLKQAAPPWMKDIEGGLTCLTCTTLTLYACWDAHLVQRRTQQAAFSELAYVRMGELADELNCLARHELLGLSGLFDASEFVSPDEFAAYARYLLTNRAITGWTWVPRIEASRRREFEARMSSEWKQPLGIWELGPDGKRRAAGPRETYYPIARGLHSDGTAVPLGLDLGAERRRRVALETAAQTGLATSTEPLQLVDDLGGRPALLIIQPVAKRHQPESILGFAIAVMHPSQLLSLDGARTDTTVLSLAMVDSEGVPIDLGESSDLPPDAEAEHTASRPIFAFGRTFAATAHAGASFNRRYSLSTVWLTGASGGAVTAALSVVVVVIYRRRHNLECLLRERSRTLRANEAWLKATLHSIGDGVISTDRQGRIADMNRVAERLIGRSVRDVKGRELREVYQTLDAKTRASRSDPVSLLLNAPGRAKIPGDGVILLSCTGDEHHIAQSTAPILDAAGESIGAVLVFRDVTEDYLRRGALRESQQRVQLAMDGADLGSWDWNIATGEISVNRRWAEMLGYQWEEIAPHISQWERLVHPEDMEKVRQTLDDHLNGVAAEYAAEFRMLCKSGEWRWVLDRGKVIERDPQGRPMRAAGTHQDIHERKEAESRREALLADLERLNRSMIGRERRVLELKKEVNDLLVEMNHQPKYHSVEAEPQTTCRTTLAESKRP